MRLFLAAAALRLAALPPAAAQTLGSPTGRSAPQPFGGLRGPAAARTDSEIEADRLRSETRLRRREEAARRTIRGICKGC